MAVGSDVTTVIRSAGDAGPHGPFTAQAKTISPQLVANTHRGAIGAAVAIVAVVGLMRMFRSAVATKPPLS